MTNQRIAEIRKSQAEGNFWERRQIGQSLFFDIDMNTELVDGYEYRIKDNGLDWRKQTDYTLMVQSYCRREFGIPYTYFEIQKFSYDIINVMSKMLKDVVEYKVKQALKRNNRKMKKARGEKMDLDSKDYTETDIELLEYKLNDEIKKNENLKNQMCALLKELTDKKVICSWSFGENKFEWTFAEGEFNEKS